MKERRKKVLAGFFLTMALAVCLACPVFAAGATTDIMASGNALREIIESAVQLVGTFVLLMGIVEWGLSWTSQDPGGQSHALKRMVGGIVVLAAPAILEMILEAS